MAEHWLSTGVLRGELNQFAVSADGSGMTVDVATGKAWIKGQYVESDAAEALSIDAADPSNPRIDRVILRNTFGAPGAPGSIALAVLKGTAAGSPTAPALTQSAAVWEISLAQVRVDAGAVVVAADKVTDERTKVNPGGDLAVLGRLVTPVQVTLTSAETTVFTKVVPGGTIGLNGMLRLHAAWDFVDDLVSDGWMYVRVKLGSTTLITWDNKDDSSNNPRGSDMTLDMLLANRDAAAVQAGHIIIGDILYEDDTLVRQFLTATEDTASDRTLSVTVQHSNAFNCITNFRLALLELIKPTI
jgi:hypothetical protein